MSQARQGRCFKQPTVTGLSLNLSLGASTGDQRPVLTSRDGHPFTLPRSGHRWLAIGWAPLEDLQGTLDPVSGTDIVSAAPSRQREFIAGRRW